MDIGIHTLQKFPFMIASELNLPNPESFTSHAMRRTAATSLVEHGGTFEELQIAGDWKSNTVPKEYVETSVCYKRKQSDLLNLSGESMYSKKEVIDAPQKVSTSSSSGVYNFSGANFGAGCTLNLVVPAASTKD